MLNAFLKSLPAIVSPRELAFAEKLGALAKASRKSEHTKLTGQGCDKNDASRPMFSKSLGRGVIRHMYK